MAAEETSYTAYEYLNPFAPDDAPNYDPSYDFNTSWPTGNTFAGPSMVQSSSTGFIAQSDAIPLVPLELIPFSDYGANQDNNEATNYGQTGIPFDDIHTQLPSAPTTFQQIPEFHNTGFFDSTNGENINSLAQFDPNTYTEPIRNDNLQQNDYLNLLMSTDGSLPQATINAANHAPIESTFEDFPLQWPSAPQNFQHIPDYNNAVVFRNTHGNNIDSLANLAPESCHRPTGSNSPQLDLALRLLMSTETPETIGTLTPETPIASNDEEVLFVWDNGVRRCAVPGCTKVFGKFRASNARRHRNQVHCADRPFACNYQSVCPPAAGTPRCTSTFKFAQDVRRHVRITHGDSQWNVAFLRKQTREEMDLQNARGRQGSLVVRNGKRTASGEESEAPRKRRRRAPCSVEK